MEFHGEKTWGMIGKDTQPPHLDRKMHIERLCKYPQQSILRS